jgi:hypothetical protein
MSTPFLSGAEQSMNGSQHGLVMECWLWQLTFTE